MDIRADAPGYPKTAGCGGFLQITWRAETIPTQSVDASFKLLCKFADEAISRCTAEESILLVEIGVYGGASLLHWVDRVHAARTTLGESRDVQVLGIDPFETISLFNGVSEENTSKNIVKAARDFLSENHKRLEEIIMRHNLEDILRILCTTSSNAHSEIENETIDVLHIDGDHSTQGVYEDLINYWPKMKSGSVVIGDDAYWPSVQRGLKKFTDQNPDINVVMDNVLGKFIIRKA